MQWHWTSAALSYATLVCSTRFLVLPLAVAITTAATLCTLCVLLIGGIEEFSGNEKALNEAVGRAQMQVTLAVAAVLLVHIVAVVWLGLLASHRIAGPIFQLKKRMEEVTKGNMSVRVHLRDHDALVEVADAFNTMIDSLVDRATPDKPKKAAAEDGN